MAMKPCRECGAEISSHAKTCPHCGIDKPFRMAAQRGLDSFGSWAIKLGLLIILLGIIGAAFAQTVRLEPDAIVDPKLKEAANLQAVLDAAAAMIRARGWRCDSISAIRRFFVSRGLDVKCNRYAYHYEIEDKGGRWVVTLQ